MSSRAWQSPGYFETSLLGERGLIYHAQTPTNGMGQLSICLTPTSGWSIHT